jgi:hypothetical protein
MGVDPKIPNGLIASGITQRRGTTVLGMTDMGAAKVIL